MIVKFIAKNAKKKFIKKIKNLAKENDVELIIAKEDSKSIKETMPNEALEEVRKENIEQRVSFMSELYAQYFRNKPIFYNLF